MLTYGAALLPMPVGAIAPGDVADVLSPIWLAKPETASRLRGRIEAVLGACIARGERSGPNPAALRDNLAHILPRQRVEVQHHAAIAVADAPAAFARLWNKRDDGMGYQVLVTVCLTAMRSGEARGLRWDEIGETAITIPRDRMKAKRPHVLPLTPRLREHLTSQSRWVATDLLHPGLNGRVVSDMTPAMALRRSGLGQFTVHGWRSTFRDWAGQEAWPRELAEHQLAHAVGDATERAYARDTLAERRRPMMEAWEAYLWTAL